MLKIIIGDLDLFNKKHNTDFQVLFKNNYYFDTNYTIDWLNNPTAKQIILDIDKSEHIQDHLIISPIFGAIPPKELSGGCKSLLIALNHPHIPQYGTHMGDNCCHWLLKISKEKDILIQLEHMMRFDRFGDMECDALILNNNIKCKTAKELRIETALFNLEYLEELLILEKTMPKKSAADEFKEFFGEELIL